jgi:phospholipid/cholesterol/gamma-HCH transport system substrate-binding protein
MNKQNKTYSYNIQLGAFILFGLAILLTAIFFVGQARQIFSQTFTITALFKDVNGLQAGNNVRFGGIHVGSISGIEMLSDTSILVSMDIESSTQKFISKDAKAIIGSDGLMGNKLLIISPGKGLLGPIADKDQIASIHAISMDDIMDKLYVTAENTNLITTDLATISESIRSGKGTIGKLFMDDDFANNLDKTLLNVKKGTLGFSETMEAAKKSIFLKGAFKKDKEKNND